MTVGVFYYTLMEFRIKKSWRVFVYVVMSSFFILTILMTYQALTKVSSGVNSLIAVTVSLSLAAFSFYSIIRIRKEKVNVENGALRHTLAFTQKTINLDEIDGFKIDEHYIRIISRPPSIKKIRISSSIEDKYEFIEFLYQRFDNLNSLNHQEEISEILSNESFGGNKIERELKLESAQRTMKVFNGVSLISFFWLIIIPNPYDLAVLVNIVIPLIALWIFYHFKGLVKLDSNKESEYPNIMSALFLPSGGLGLRILFDFEVLSLDNVWTPTLIFSALLFGLIFIRSEELKIKNFSSLLNSLLSFVFISLYLFTSILMLNYLLDSSSSSVYESPVAKKITPSDNNNYRLVVEPDWSMHDIDEKEVTVTVTKNFFHRIEVGDTVFVELYSGAFNIPWLDIDELKNSTSFKNIVPLSFPEDSVFIDDFRYSP